MPLLFQLLGYACSFETFLCIFNCGRHKPYDKMLVNESSTHFTLHETSRGGGGGSRGGGSRGPAGHNDDNDLEMAATSVVDNRARREGTIPNTTSSREPPTSRMEEQRQNRRQQPSVPAAAASSAAARNAQQQQQSSRQQQYLVNENFENVPPTSSASMHNLPPAPKTGHIPPRRPDDRERESDHRHRSKPSAPVDLHEPPPAPPPAAPTLPLIPPPPGGGVVCGGAESAAKSHPLADLTPEATGASIANENTAKKSPANVTSTRTVKSKTSSSAVIDHPSSSGRPPPPRPAHSSSAESGLSSSSSLTTRADHPATRQTTTTALVMPEPSPSNTAAADAAAERAKEDSLRNTGAIPKKRRPTAIQPTPSNYSHAPSNNAPMPPLKPASNVVGDQQDKLDEIIALPLEDTDDDVATTVGDEDEANHFPFDDGCEADEDSDRENDVGKRSNVTSMKASCGTTPDPKHLNRSLNGDGGGGARANNHEASSTIASKNGRR